MIDPGLITDLIGGHVPLAIDAARKEAADAIAAKEGGPSLDWINPELGYLQSQRSRA